MGNLFAGGSLELLTIDAIDILTSAVTQEFATTKHKGYMMYDPHIEVLSIKQESYIDDTLHRNMFPHISISEKSARSQDKQTVS